MRRDVARCRPQKADDVPTWIPVGTRGEYEFTRVDLDLVTGQLVPIK